MYLYPMKRLLLLIYSLYFTLLMIVPCNHTVLYTNVMENVFGLNMHSDCNHVTDTFKENHHHHEQNNHHHSCTPFCSCGISYFILNTPPFQRTIAKSITTIYEFTIWQQTVWLLNYTRYKKLMVNDIWNPPQMI